MTMQIRTAEIPENEKATKFLENVFQKWPNSEDADSDVLGLRSYRNTETRECMNWQNVGLNNTDDEK